MKYRAQQNKKNPGGGEFFRIRPDRPWGPLGLLYYGYLVSCPGVKRLYPWTAGGAEQNHEHSQSWCFDRFEPSISRLHVTRITASAHLLGYGEIKAPDTLLFVRVWNLVSHIERKTGWGCLRIRCWWRYLGLRRRRLKGNGEDCIKRTFTICTSH
jgi:hypothetical protein